MKHGKITMIVFLTYLMQPCVKIRYILLSFIQMRLLLLFVEIIKHTSPLSLFLCCVAIFMMNKIRLESSTGYFIKLRKKFIVGDLMTSHQFLIIWRKTGVVCNKYIHNRIYMNLVYVISFTNIVINLPLHRLNI